MKLYPTKTLLKNGKEVPYINVMNWRVAEHLKRQGFQVLYVRKNKNEPNKHVNAFEKTCDFIIELRRAIKKYEGVSTK